MELLTGLLVGFAVLGSLVQLEVIDDETGQRRLLKGARGQYSRESLEAYRNKKVEIEFEWGDDQKARCLRISFPSPSISI